MDDLRQLFGPGEWIENTVVCLTKDEDVRSIFKQFLIRTIGEDADDIHFPYEGVDTSDGNGRAEKADTIGHWLCTEARLDRSILFEDRISKLLSIDSIDTIWEHAKSRLEETGFTNSYPPLDSDEVIVAELENGYTLVELTCSEAVVNEYEYSKLNGWTHPTFSNFILRDRDNISILNFGVEDEVVTEICGPHDRRIPFHISEAFLIPFIKDRGYELASPTVIHEAVQTSDGEIYDLRDIPDGSTIDGDLMIHYDGKNLSRLPDNLTINGNFGLCNCTYIREVPRNLKVAGNIGFLNCPGLKSIRSGLSAGGYCDFETCHNIQVIEDNVSFGEKVHLSGRIIELSAMPFHADSIAIETHVVRTLLKDRQIPRDAEGRAVIDAAFMRKALRREFQKTLVKIPGELVNIAYKSMANNVGRKIRSMQRTINPNIDNNGDKSSTPPKL